MLKITLMDKNDCNRIREQTKVGAIIKILKSYTVALGNTHM